MEVTLDASALKPFTKALACLSKYGDELAIYATSDALSLSATNSSKSAYCRFKYDKQFFSRYSVGLPQSRREAFTDDVEEVLTVTGQLLTKSLLSILKHRTVEKSVERCELLIIEGAEPQGDQASSENHDSLESKLVIRLHCKHGVTKTHRLLLLTPTSLMTPGIPDALNESQLTIGPKAVKDMIEHFPRGAKSDPQLIWSFGETEVGLKSLESSTDSKGKAQLSTELSISADEFEIYNVYAPPTTIAFHLREFNATIAFADSMSLPLDIRFTDPAAPLFIDVEGDNSETLFVISTSQVHGIPAGYTHNAPPSHKKREREETPVETVRFKKPMKAVQPATPASLVSERRPRPRSDLPATMLPPAPPRLQPSQPSPPETYDVDMPPPSLPPQYSPPTPHLRDEASLQLACSRRPLQTDPSAPPVPLIPREPLFLPSNSQLLPTARPSMPCASPVIREIEPLFLPSSSQLSCTDEESLRASGLWVENMDADELEEMLEGEGEEVAFDLSARQLLDGTEHIDHPPIQEDEDPDSLEIVEDPELAPTQASDSSVKMFQPLFED